MGMYDSVVIGKEASKRFNVPEDVYQTKQFNLALDTFEIREDGTIKLKGEPHVQFWLENIPNKDAIMCNIDGVIVMCRTENNTPYTIDYTVNVVNGYVTHITETAKTREDYDVEEYLDIDKCCWEYE